MRFAWVPEASALAFSTSASSLAAISSRRRCGSWKCAPPIARRSASRVAAACASASSSFVGRFRRRRASGGGAFSVAGPGVIERRIVVRERRSGRWVHRRRRGHLRAGPLPPVGRQWRDGDRRRARLHLAELAEGGVGRAFRELGPTPGPGEALEQRRPSLHVVLSTHVATVARPRSGINLAPWQSLFSHQEGSPRKSGGGEARTCLSILVNSLHDTNSKQSPRRIWCGPVVVKKCERAGRPRARHAAPLQCKTWERSSPPRRCHPPLLVAVSGAACIHRHHPRVAYPRVNPTFREETGRYFPCAWEHQPSGRARCQSYPNPPTRSQPRGDAAPIPASAPPACRRPLQSRPPQPRVRSRSCAASTPRWTRWGRRRSRWHPRARPSPSIEERRMCRNRTVLRMPAGIS